MLMWVKGQVVYSSSNKLMLLHARLAGLCSCYANIALEIWPLNAADLSSVEYGIWAWLQEHVYS